MSFRSMLLLRRSADLEDEETTYVPNVAVGKVEGAIVIVEARPQEMSHVAAILESLNIQTLNVTGESAALKLIHDQSPRMVLSSRRLPSLKGYNLRRDLPQTTPFVYLPEADQRAFSDESGSHEDQVFQEVRVSGQPSETEQDKQQDPLPEEKLATAEDILKGFRESDADEASVDEWDGEQAKDPTAEQEENGEEEELARIQRYRAEYQAQQKDPELSSESPAENSLEVLFDPRPQSPEQVDSLFEDTQADSEQEEPPNSFLSQEDLIPPDLEEEYSIIERIDAEEIKSLSHGDVLAENRAEANPLHHQDLYEEARSYVLDSIRASDGGKIPDLIKGKSVAERIVSSVDTGSELLLSATDRTQDFAISSHSVNTSIFAVRIAMALGLSRWQQLRITLAALLHEIGVVRLPKKLVFKTEKPTLEEIKVLRKRPIYAARCLKEVGSRFEWLPEVVGQVYERENGTGHPLGLTGREISEEAKVIGIADLFDACIHRRPYREALTGYQALFELTTDQARTFSDRIVKALIKSLSLFPYNEFVVLSSGEIGKVVEINLENLSRPVVEVIYDKGGVAVETAKPIDLAQNPSLYISKALPYRSLPAN